MAAFSLDLRCRVLTDCQGGMTFAAVARKYTVSAEWVRTFFKRFNETGEVAPRSHATKRQPFHVRHEAELRTALAEKPDRTLEELRRHLGLPVSIGTLWHALNALKISFKKSRSTRLSKDAPTFRPDASHGKRGRSVSTRTGSSSSTRPGSSRT
jgi:transposase